jgi:hypothetical protein
MQTPTLNYPVYTLDGKQLLPAGTELNETVLREVAKAGRRGCRYFNPLLDHGSVRQDLQEFINNQPYSVIFGDTEAQRDLWLMLEEVRVIVLRPP